MLILLQGSLYLPRATNNVTYTKINCLLSFHLLATSVIMSPKLVQFIISELISPILCNIQSHEYFPIMLQMLISHICIHDSLTITLKH